MAYKHIVSQEPQVFKRGFQTTVRCHIDCLISTRPTFDNVCNTTCIVTKRCSNSTRHERIIAAPCIPLTTINSGTTTQAALSESVSSQRFVVSVLTMQRSIFYALQPRNFCIYTIHAKVSAVFTIRSCASLADRCSWHTKHGMISTIPSGIGTATATVTCGIVKHFQDTLFITQQFARAIPLQPTTRHGCIGVTVNSCTPRRASLA